MSNHAGPEVSRQLHDASEGNLVSTIQSIGAAELVRLCIIARAVHEVTILSLRSVPGESIRDLQVQGMCTPERITHVLLQGSLQTVINRASDWKQHLVSPESGRSIGAICNATEGRVGAGASAAEFITRVQPVRGEVHDGGSAS